MTDTAKQSERLPKYAYGDELFAAGYEGTTERLTCPECGGTKTLRCILWDGTEHVIDCAGCAAGYEPPKGFVEIFKHHAVTRQAKVVSVEREWDGSGFSYRSEKGVSSAYVYKEENLFRTEAEAFERAAVMAAEATQAEKDKFAQKEKPTRTWAWHVHYHRQEIRRAERELAYHTEKLNAAKKYAKPDRLALKEDQS